MIDEKTRQADDENKLIKYLSDYDSAIEDAIVKLLLSVIDRFYHHLNEAC